ncbi:MAG: phosphoribosyltransferase family protein, partial [Nitrososphaeraceae archaeon]|nr:phosphoribosyltransferase family protein [Nitrososphaeraceae archaeon]
NRNGLRTTYNPLPQPQKFCIFEKIYFSRPDSMMDGESLSAYRHRLGRKLAMNDRADDHDVIFADYVFGVPDSGTPAAIGYAEQLGLSYRPGIVKNRYSGRTFISPTQEMRDKKALLKYNIIKEYVTEQRVVLIDDSIVRGTTMRKLVRDLRDAGAVEVHVRITAPPIQSACNYGIDTYSEDLIATKHNSLGIRQEIGADSLRFLSVYDVEQLAFTTTRQYCTDCFHKTL